MAGTIPVLWPDEIEVDVLSPFAILRAQVDPLRQRTGGLLEAEITKATSDARIRLSFNVLAPLIDNYEQEILAASYEVDQVYPVSVEAECLWPEEDLGWPVAATQDEFVKLVGRVFRSKQVLSVIQSLIARSNELRDEAEPDKPQGSGPG